MYNDNKNNTLTKQNIVFTSYIFSVNLNVWKSQCFVFEYKLLHNI